MNKNVNVALQPHIHFRILQKKWRLEVEPVCLYSSDSCEFTGSLDQPVDQNPKWLLTEFFVFSPHAHESVCLQSYDNGDSQLDSSELLKFIQHNESVVELQSYADQESNNLLRLVCLQVCVLVKKCGSGRGERAFKYFFSNACTKSYLCAAALF